MRFHFIDKSNFSITNYSYLDFDALVKKFGYRLEKNKDFHNYFEWGSIKHWYFNYELYDEKMLSKMLSKSFVKNNINSAFLIRLEHQVPLIQVETKKLISIINDLYYECSGMGWEAISIDGKYIMEFTDSYEHLAKSNFEILGFGNPNGADSVLQTK